MSPLEWDSLEWYYQRTYIDGLIAEGLLVSEDGERAAEEEAGFSHRTADTGAGVIDLNEMRAALGGR